MSKKYKFLLIIPIALIFLISFLLIMKEGKKEKEISEVLSFSDTIQSIEIIDGTNGNKVKIEEVDELNELQSILQASKLISAMYSKETTGYRWRVIITSNNHRIDVTSQETVSYDKEEVKFLNKDDYARFEECITILYNKYTETITAQ